MNASIKTALRRSQGKPIVEPAKPNKWDVVASVFEIGDDCVGCEWRDKHGECKLLTRDNMIADFCSGFDVEQDNLTSFPQTGE